MEEARGLRCAAAHPEELPTDRKDDAAMCRLQAGISRVNFRAEERDSASV
jgi:hypothetical protein